MNTGINQDRRTPGVLSRHTLAVIVGAQYGSEGKGHVAAQVIKHHEQNRARVLADDRKGPVINIRVAGPNAGHSVVDANGHKFALRTVPVGAALGNHILNYIAPGSEIDLEVLASEISDLRQRGHATPLIIHGEATILTEQHRAAEQSAKMHERLGSTGKGIGAARADRIMRKALRFKDDENAMDLADRFGIQVVDDFWLRSIVDSPDPALLVVEGTQGYGLGLHAGHYPRCTSSDTRAIDFLAMAGLSPWHRNLRANFVVYAVARVYPIRVAGNSGPLKGETDWEALGLPEERTTVTHKVRRVGAWDSDLLKAAVAANGGAPVVRVALTMVDQKVPEAEGLSSDLPGDIDLPAALTDLLDQVEQDAGGAYVSLVTTSDRTAVWL